MIKDIECSKFINKNYVSKDKIREILEKYKHTDIQDIEGIMSFYKEIKELQED